MSTPETVKLLLEQPNININLKDEEGIPPLIYAIGSNFTEEIFLMLLNHPNIDVNIQDSYGDTALIEAMKCMNSKAIEILLNRPNIDVNIENKNNWGALYLSIFHSKNNNLHKIWKLFSKHKIRHNMFYFYNSLKYDKKNYDDGLRDYMIFQRFNMINHRRFYRKHYLNKIY
jgi:ankyrin repeat protein